MTTPERPCEADKKKSRPDVVTVVCDICGRESLLSKVHALIPYSKHPESMEPPNEEFWCDRCYGEEAAQGDREHGTFWRGPSRPEKKVEPSEAARKAAEEIDGFYANPDESGGPIEQDEVMEIINRHMQAEQDEFKTALHDAAVVTCCIDPDKHSPRELLHRIIQWNVKGALDPAVSREAAQLRDTYKEELERLRGAIHRIANLAAGHLYLTSAEKMDQIADLVHRALKGTSDEP